MTSSVHRYPTRLPLSNVLPVFCPPPVVEQGPRSSSNAPAFRPAPVAGQSPAPPSRTCRTAARPSLQSSAEAARSSAPSGKNIRKEGRLVVRNNHFTHLPIRAGFPEPGPASGRDGGGGAKTNVGEPRNQSN